MLKESQVFRKYSICSLAKILCDIPTSFSIMESFLSPSFLVMLSSAQAVIGRKVGGVGGLLY